MFFISTEKIFLFSSYLNFCLDFSVMQKKQLNEKEKVNFETDDIAAWFINSTHIAHYLPNWRQPDNEIC